MQPAPLRSSSRSGAYHGLSHHTHHRISQHRPGEILHDPSKATALQSKKFVTKNLRCLLLLEVICVRTARDGAVRYMCCLNGSCPACADDTMAWAHSHVVPNKVLQCTAMKVALYMRGMPWPDCAQFSAWPHCAHACKAPMASNGALWV